MREAPLVEDAVIEHGVQLIKYWFEVGRKEQERDDKKRARLNCISHLLSQIHYKALTGKSGKLGKQNTKGKYDDHASMAKRRFVPSVY